MSDLIERIKERIRREFTLNEDFCDYISVARANRIIDEEPAKEPQDVPDTNAGDMISRKKLIKKLECRR